MLKKLGKLPSANQDYFQSNSSAKTTEEYKALTAPNTFNYLFKLVKQFEVQLSIEDFIELSDSIAPRLFTIASDYNVQKNVIVAVSLVKHGLMS